MADPTLIQRAEAAGIAPEFRDWRGRQVAVSEQTLAAILDALDSVPDLPRAAGADEPGADEPGADEPGADEPGPALRFGRTGGRGRRGPAPPAGPPVLGVHRPALLGPVPALVGPW